MLTHKHQPQMNPCHGPNASRVHAYRPPCSGYRLDRARTAAASGRKNEIHARIQRTTDGAPIRAARGIQRRDTTPTRVMAITSRRVSSRINPAVACSDDGFDVLRIRCASGPCVFGHLAVPQISREHAFSPRCFFLQACLGIPPQAWSFYILRSFPGSESNALAFRLDTDCDPDLESDSGPRMTANETYT